jgi:uncharacterized protein YndB with AHSA1/START domain
VAKLHQGYLLIADISGYTTYLNESELDHAQQTLTALLELLVENTKPPLHISRLQGDAVCSYAFEESFFIGQTFIEVIENTYVAFRKAINLMVLNTTCQCKACANISMLDLKFFFHFGTFGIQHISGQDELVGSDVNLIHRLLKNNIRETFGFQAYTVYTDAAINRLELEEISVSMLPHFEKYEDIGEVKVWVQDLKPVWQRMQNANPIRIPPEKVLMRIEYEFDMSPEHLWEYLSLPQFRNIYFMAEREEVTNLMDGRIAPGSVYQCYHGDKIISQTILEWQPFERMILQQTIPIPIPDTTLLFALQLIPNDKGTRLIEITSKPRGPLFGRILTILMLKLMTPQAKKHAIQFKKEIERDVLAKKGMQSTVINT